jgi:hypothetical protein
MATTSDIFAHHDRDHRANREISSQQVTRRRQVDERLVDELAPRLADRLAPLLIELVADRLGVTPEQPHGLGDPFTERPEALVDAGEVARRAGRSRWWVYEHASELGAVRLGSGSKPRLAFWPSRVDEYLQAAAQLRQPIPAPVRVRPQRRQHAGRTSTGMELLPIEGRDA